MQIQREEKSGATIFHISGRLDAPNSPVVEEHVQREIALEPAKMIFDLTEVDYLSSAGLRILLAATKRLGAGKVAIYGAAARVMETIRMAGFDKVLEIASNEDEALGGS